jgi:hypothetical protein
MDLVVDGVLNRCQSGALPAPKCFVNFTEPVWRNVGEFRVELLRLRIPELSYLSACQSKDRDEQGVVSPFLSLRLVRDNVDRPENENRVHDK